MDLKPWLAENKMRKVEFNKSKGNEFRVLCPQCEIETRHIVIQSAEINGSVDLDDDFWIGWESKHQILECQGCQTISYREESSNSEDFDPRTGRTEILVRLYPRRTNETLFIKEFINTPSNINRIYREVIDCFNNQIDTLCSAGLRAIIEGICAEVGIIDGPVVTNAKGGGTKVVRKQNLEGKISGLNEKGILTESYSQILHEHRYMGNAAVHELARPSRAELKLAINIVEHVLESVFEIPLKATTLRMARKKTRSHNKPFQRTR